MEIAMEMVARDQPNSCSSGTISTPGVARMAAEDEQDDKGDGQDDPGVVRLLHGAEFSGGRSLA